MIYRMFGWIFVLIVGVKGLGWSEKSVMVAAAIVELLLIDNRLSNLEEPVKKEKKKHDIG